MQNQKEKHMKRARWKTVLSLLTLCASLTAAGEEPGISFSYEDWEVVCDNTRACRMAGYSSEDAADGERGSVLITRAAGPNAPLEGLVTLANFSLADNPDWEALFDRPDVLTLHIDGKARGKLSFWLEPWYALAPAQIQAIIAAARADGVVRFEGVSNKGRTKSFTLSGEGISVVMEKMDEAQGRIGTPGALSRKGKKSEKSVFPPLPIPIIRAAKVGDAPPRALTEPEVMALIPVLWADEKPGQMCNRHEPGSAEHTLMPLDERHVLISERRVSSPRSLIPMDCFLAVPDMGATYWVMDSTLEGTPKLIVRDADEYSGGIILRHVSGRLADCGRNSAWVWDGGEFRQSAERESGMCRRIRAGGTWILPRLITRILHEDGTLTDGEGYALDPG
jgi:hypothetical protein